MRIRRPVLKAAIAGNRRRQTWGTLPLPKEARLAQDQAVGQSLMRASLYQFPEAQEVEGEA